MARYRFADLILASAFAIPELPRAAGFPSIDLSIGPLESGAPRTWRHAWTVPGGRTWMRVAPTRDGHVIQFPGYAEFAVTRRTIVCAPRRGLPLATLRHLLLDQVLPAIIASPRRLVLHASAVTVDGGAVGFLGRAGAGKSTLAAAMARRGARVVTDDALLIEVGPEGPRAIPSYPGLRLWPEARELLGSWGGPTQRVAHYTRKRRLSGGLMRFCRGAVPLRALFVVGRGARAAVREIAPRDAMMTLIRHSMMLDATDRHAVRAGFDLAARVAAQVPVRRLTLPAGRGALAAACDDLGPIGC